MKSVVSKLLPLVIPSGEWDPPNTRNNESEEQLDMKFSTTSAACRSLLDFDNHGFKWLGTEVFL